MTTHARENLLRLMAAEGLSLREVVKRTGLNARTVRGIIRGANKPHSRTLHRLAKGLGVNTEEFFVDPAQLLYRRFDRRANPLVDQIVKEHADLFQNWTEADFDELHSRVGEGGALTAEGALAAIRMMNEKRELHEKLDVLLESSQAEIVADLLGLLYEKVAVRE